MEITLNSSEAIEILENESKVFEFKLTEIMIKRFQRYLEALADYNQKVNLVSNADPVNVVKRHVLDCLAVADIVRGGSQAGADGEWVKHQNLLDIGSGGGLPGLVLAIALEDFDVVLMDSIAKKTRFLEMMVDELELGDRVSVITGRAEEESRGARRATFDVVTSRAVGHLGLVSELAMPFLKVKGRLLCLKSTNQCKVELKALENLLKPLGASSAELIKPSIQVSDYEHTVVSIEKQKETADNYPRPWSEIIRHWK